MGDQIERKLTAILAADIAGYSRLMAADEEGTLARLKSHRRELIDPKIKEHRGRIIKTTGDGMLVEFASVVDAVRCAVDVQRGMIARNAEAAPDRRIEFRVGVNLGDVIVDGDDIYGDGVNIAARLENIAEPGGIRVSATVRDHVLDKLGFAFDDLGEQQLKNIARPVRVYRVDPRNQITTPAQAGIHHAAIAPTATMDPGLRRGGNRILISALAVVVLLIVIAGGTWYFLGANKSAPAAANVPAPAEAARLSIVVLPFTNLGGDPSQDYFADGITENLTTDLSRIRNSFVIARNTAFTYKGKDIDAKEIAKELDVRYVLEGSVQRDQNHVRVNAQLIDAESGAHLWADRFEEDVVDLFKLQDEVVARLANTLGYELVRAEAGKSAQSRDPNAIDLTMRGWALMWQPPPNKERSESAREFFEQALKLDPQNAEALAGIAYTDVRAYAFGWTANLADAAAEAMDMLAKATAINPNYAYAYWLKSTMLFLTKQLPEALQAAQTGLTINPNSAPAYFAMGQAEFPLGLCDQAIAHIKEAFKLSPRDPSIGLWHMNIGNAEFCLGHDDAAIEEENQAIAAGFRPWVPYTWLAAAYTRKGNEVEAKAALAEAKRVVPEITVKWVITRSPNVPAYFDALRKAGLPEE